MILEPGRPFTLGYCSIRSPASVNGCREPMARYKMKTRPHSTAGSLKFTHHFGLNCFLTFRRTNVFVGFSHAFHQGATIALCLSALDLGAAALCCRRLNCAERSGDRNRPADRSGLSKASGINLQPKIGGLG